MRSPTVALLSAIFLTTATATAAENRERIERAPAAIGDDAALAIQDGLLNWLDTMLRWAGITDYRLVGFKLTPTEDPSRWRGGFMIREEGCDEDRLVDGEWFYINTDVERAVATQTVVTRKCNGQGRSVNMMIKVGLANVPGDGEVPHFKLAAGEYRGTGGACAHAVVPTYEDQVLTSLAIENHCDGEAAVFNCESNWCSGPDLLTQIQVTSDNSYSVYRVLQKFDYESASVRTP